MILGVDFDNTIVCYDQVFHAVAVERGLIPPGTAVSKNSVRDHLRRSGREDVWTEMQGYVYGARMTEARAFPGVEECLMHLAGRGVRLYIISHKTRTPYAGDSYDLHRSAFAWLEQEGFFDAGRLGLSRDQVFFELGKQEKIRRIVSSGCTHFVDDLPDFLAERAFPASVRRLLFDPNHHCADVQEFQRFASWAEIEGALSREA